MSFAVIFMLCNEAVFVGSHDGEEGVANFDLAADFNAVDVFDFAHGVVWVTALCSQIPRMMQHLFSQIQRIILEAADHGMRTRKMQATIRRLSVVSLKSCAHGA